MNFRSPAAYRDRHAESCVDPVVSVLLPVRDGASCVGRAVEGVLGQSFGDLELIAVENGSRDGTLDVLREYAGRDKRVRVFSLDCAGIVGALNYGLAAARGEFVARMDADDVCHPERLARQVAHLRECPDTGLVGCLVRHAGDAEAQAGYAAYVAWMNSLVTHEQIVLQRFVESPFAHPSVCFRRAVAERHGAWRDGPFPEDYELWLRWLDAGVRMEKVAELLLDWHDPPGRLSRVDARYHPRAFAAMKAGYLARFLKAGALEGRRLVVWGAGRETRLRLRALWEHGLWPAGWVDINPRKWGQRIEGAEVWRPEEMPGPVECFVVAAVSNRGARELIAPQLEARGFVAGADYVLAG